MKQFRYFPQLSIFTPSSNSANISLSFFHRSFETGNKSRGDARIASGLINSHQGRRRDALMSKVSKVLRAVEREKGKAVRVEGPICMICGKPTVGIRDGGFVSLICPKGWRCKKKRVQQLCEELKIEDYSRNSRTTFILKRITNKFRVQYLGWKENKEKHRHKMYTFYKNMALLLELLLLIRERPGNKIKFDFGDIFDEIMMSEEVKGKIEQANKRNNGIKQEAA